MYKDKFQINFTVNYEPI